MFYKPEIPDNFVFLVVHCNGVKSTGIFTVRVLHTELAMFYGMASAYFTILRGLPRSSDSDSLARPASKTLFKSSVKVHTGKYRGIFHEDRTGRQHRITAGLRLIPNQ